MSLPFFSATRAVLLVHVLTSVVCMANYRLNMTCSPPASQGGTGFCGPSFCDTVKVASSACVFTDKVYNYPLLMSKLSSKTCTQSTDARCSSAALKALMFGQGIKAAYCNDAFLVIHTDQTSGFANYLGSIKNPPAAVGSDGNVCVTRYTNPSFATVKIPLNPTLLSTADQNINNINLKSFPNGGGSGNAAYLSSSSLYTAATYGVPSRGKKLHTYLKFINATAYKCLKSS